MTEPYFNLVFRGEISPDLDIHEVKRNISSLLKTDLSRVEAMFNGGTVVLKKNITRTDADKYKQLFDKTGALSVVEAVIAPESQATFQLQSPVAPGLVKCSKCGATQEKGLSCVVCGAVMEETGNEATEDSFGNVKQVSIMCPKCGTTQAKTACCEKCGIIFERIGMANKNPPGDSQPSQPLSILGEDFPLDLNAIKRALPSILIMLIVILPVTVCLMVEEWSGKEIVRTKLSESSAVLVGSAGVGSENTTLSDSAAPVYLSPEMKPIRIMIKYAELQVSQRGFSAKYEFSFSLKDKNGEAVFSKNGFHSFKTDKTSLVNMLTGGDRSTEFLGVLNICRAGNYRISYHEKDWNGARIRGARTVSTLIMRRNTIFVPIHWYIVSLVSGFFVAWGCLAAKRRWM